MNAPLRIAVPIHSFEPGGVERVALNLALQWQEAGHGVHVVLGRDQGADRDRAPAGLDYRTRPTRIPTAAFETLWMMWCLVRHVTREKVDVIFCPGNTYTVVCVVLRLLLGERCPPVVVKISNDLVRLDLPPPIRQAYYLWLAVQRLLLDHFVALAEPMHDEIVTVLGATPSRVTTIHDPALDAARLARLGALEHNAKARNACRFVAVGRLAAQKNLPLLLEAYARGRRPGDHLALVGDGPERGRLEALAERLDLRHHLSFIGNAGDVDRHLAEADVFVLSSDYEGVPAAVIEAIAAGLPVIATRCSSSMAELLGTGARGIIVPPRDANALADAIADARTMPAPAAQDRRYAERFTLERAGVAYLSLMARTVATARRERLAALGMAA